MNALRARSFGIWVSAALLGGCASSAASKNASPPSKSIASSTPRPGHSPSAPIEACGPRESYQIVADLTCPDGRRPLAGDLRLGQRARIGTKPPHQRGASVRDSHIVDVYRLPCSGGPVLVYVCLYHCPR